MSCNNKDAGPQAGLDVAPGVGYLPKGHVSHWEGSMRCPQQGLATAITSTASDDAFLSKLSPITPILRVDTFSDSLVVGHGVGLR